jgi:hypothetical protein
MPCSSGERRIDALGDRLKVLSCSSPMLRPMHSAHTVWKAIVAGT